MHQKGQLKIAMAPERKGAIACIHHAVKKNIHVAIGHTNANYEICQNAIQAGATIFVHTFNGMKGLHHREPGVVGRYSQLSMCMVKSL